MTDPSPNAGISPLDEAHRFLLEKSRDKALRLACTLLENDLTDLGAASLVAEALAEDHPDVSRNASVRLVDSFIRRGDLPSAVIAAQVGHAAGSSLSRLLGAVAEAFSRESSRLGAAAASPPPLPRPVAVSKELAGLTGPRLAARAKECLERFLGTTETIGDDFLVPNVPLFSALGPSSLARLLHCLRRRDAQAGAVVITQGEEGTEAFIVVRGMLEAFRARPEGETRLAVFGPGAILGEMALVSEAPRAASVRAVEGSRLLVVSREKLEAEAATEPAIGRELGAFCRERMVANLVRHSPILAAVDASDRDDLVERFTTRSFDVGQRLVRRDTDAPGLFLIASGHVSVEGTDVDGERIRLAELGPGDVVGEISLVLRRPATADVVATHPTIALHLPREDFHQAIKDHPSLLAELYDLAISRDDETQSVVGQQALDVDDVCLL